jgi:plasmid stabilization system protein ParE
VFLNDFKLDLVCERDWYNLHSDGLGNAFVVAVDNAVEHVIEWPESCRNIREGVRRKRLKRFPLSVVYRLTPAEIIFIGIFHGAQDFERWLTRRNS